MATIRSNIQQDFEKKHERQRLFFVSMILRSISQKKKFRPPPEYLTEKYEISTDITGSKYISLAINWNYEENYEDISMPDTPLSHLLIKREKRGYKP